MTVNIEDLGSPACWGVEGAAHQVKVRIIGPKEGKSMKFSLASTVEDVKRAVAGFVGIDVVDMAASKSTGFIFNNPMVCKELTGDMGKIADLESLVAQYLGSSPSDLLDTNTLQQCGIVEGSMLIIHQKPITQKDVLLDLYKRCGGETWTNSTNWGSDRPLKEWYGVTCNLESGAIESIDLRMNNLTGLIPASLGNLRHLKILCLDRNQLRGPIPASLGNLQRLKLLDLQNNQLSGEIPASLGNLQNLLSLYLSYNQLSGEIPEELGNLQQLERLALRGNPGLDVEGAQVIAALRARDVVVE